MSTSQHDEPGAASHRPGPLEHVFVATDFSAGGAQAVARAGRLPLIDGARISVVHALPDGLPRKLRASAEKEARRQLRQVGSELERAVASLDRRDIEVATDLCEGQPHVEIIRRARAAGADLVVLGRHGRRPVRDLFIGSTAERVIRTGDLPVLVVTRKGTRGYRRPLIAVGLEDTCRSVIDVALRVLDPTVSGDATLVHAYRVPFEGFLTPGVAPGQQTEFRKEYGEMAAAGLVKLQASLADLGMHWQSVVLYGDPRSAIVTEATRRRTDLLAVGTHGRSGLSHMLLGSVAEWVIRAAPCDVLVARPARVSFALP